jgi:hypothetical protein
MTSSEDPHSVVGTAAVETDDPANPASDFPSVALGGIVGIPIGAFFGAVASYMLGAWDELWNGVLVGAFVGPVIGSLTILFQRLARGVREKNTIATRVGLVIGLIPTFFILMKVGQGVRVWLLIGAAFIGPAAGY